MLTRRKELGLKRAASLVDIKNLQIVEPDIFQSLTGYTHGGCSPFGMKTQLPMIVERSALNWENIYLSGGKIGLLLEVSPNALLHTLGQHLNQSRKSNTQEVLKWNFKN